MERRIGRFTGQARRPVGGYLRQDVQRARIEHLEQHVALCDLLAGIAQPFRNHRGERHPDGHVTRREIVREPPRRRRLVRPATRAA